MFINDLPPLTDNAWQQAKRMTFGSTLGWAVASYFNFPYFSFYAIYPLVLLGLMPKPINAQAAIHYLASTLYGLICAGFLVGECSHYPLVMTASFIFCAWICFACMARELFFFGSSAIIVLTSVVHLASYPTTDWNDLFFAQFRSGVLSILISFIAWALFPNRAAPARPAPPKKTLQQINHQTWLGTICCTAQFIAFQILDLSDSFGAQIGTILILMSMRRDIIWPSAQKRFIGVFLSCSYVLLAQIFFHDVNHIWLITLFAYIVGMLIFATLHSREGRPGRGFPGATTIAILYGSFTPEVNQIGSSIYRAVSLTIAISLMLICVNLTHHFLNKFKATYWP